jgi:Trk-type K+ transport system membrane component
MLLINNYKEVLRKAWSVRLIVLAGVLSGLEAILPMFVSNFPRGLFAVLSMVTTTGAFVARLVVQRDLQKEPKNAGNDAPNSP